MSDSAPFFIIGAGRSGTTLLRLIMTGHSRLHIPPETWFLQPLVENFPLTEPLTHTQCQRAIMTMIEHERWADTGLSVDALRSQAALLDPVALVDLINIAYRHMLDASGKPRIGDKTPHYVAIVPQLATIYPAAKFIHLIRDGHDVAISWIDVGWQRYYESGFGWRQAMAQRVRQRVAYPDRILEVRYEDLVRQPETVVRAICGFLGETFEPEMLNWQGRMGLVAPRDRHLHDGLRRPLSDAAIAGWRRRLSAAECFAMEACLHRELVAAGYPLRFRSAGWRPLLHLTAGLLRTIAPLIRHTVPRMKRYGILSRTVYF